jgi:hypothetical protein
VLPTRDEFLQQEFSGLAICGTYCGADNVHVGICWRLDDESKIVHFECGDIIPLEDISDPKFASYYFNPLESFDFDLVPLFAATAELAAGNAINGFKFNRIGVYYNGGRFEYEKGSFTGKTAAEKYVNCGVYVLLLLQSFEYYPLDWETWPAATPQNRTFLEEWLNLNNVPADEREPYYRQTKVVRGKHVLISPSTDTQPSPYLENDPMANELVEFMIQAATN